MSDGQTEISVCWLFFYRLILTQGNLLRVAGSGVRLLGLDQRPCRPRHFPQLITSDSPRSRADRLL